MRIPVGPIRIDEAVVEKAKRIAKTEHRSANAQIAFWIERGVEEWEREHRRDTVVEHYCEVCSDNGLETPATRHAVERWLCDECAREYESYLKPGERLDDMTKEEMDRRIYS